VSREVFRGSSTRGEQTEAVKRIDSKMLQRGESTSRLHHMIFKTAEKYMRDIGLISDY
jgi:type II secretory pathway component PulF